MIRGLNQVPWERVDVSFIKSRQRYAAHNTIQARAPPELLDNMLVSNGFTLDAPYLKLISKDYGGS
ncbi:hypothetical protein ACLOJK_040447 [Asimina triloba]